MRILESKGHLNHRHEGNRYVYLPTVDRQAVRLSALEHVIQTFFDGSAADAVTALLAEREQLSDGELAELAEMIRDARKEGR